ncbi:sialophorin [Rhinolophus ferrumequinum]|uniref:Sialophorin n=1 Tax=Rhinolophus ferrumequinum TaxID=59479 RepID=A0A7J7R6J4_RHIFE|nr:sialophorin [Rhinolophus ferrumequinum]
MTLLLLLFGSVWAEDLDMTPSTQPTLPGVSATHQTLTPNSMTSHHTVTSVLGENNQITHQVITPRHATRDTSFLETSTANSYGPSLSEPAISPEPLTNKSMVQDISTKTSNPAVLAVSASGGFNMTGGTNATRSLEASNGTNESTVAMATASPEASNGTTGSTVAMATGSLETSNGTGSIVTTIAGHLESSRGTIGPSVIMTSSSLETSDGTSEPPITMVTRTVEISKGTSGLPVTMTTSSPKTPKGTSGSPISPISTVEISTIPTSEPLGSYKGTKNTLLMAVLVAMLVVIVLLALLLLWRQRQKRRTGALTLSRGAKRNGVVDAWVGPAPVSDEEAVITTVGVSGGDKGSGVPGEGSGRRPTLTTFFGRRKSRQGSLALEELKAGSASSIKGEEEPLVGSEDEVLESPISDGPEVGDAEVV